MGGTITGNLGRDAVDLGDKKSEIHSKQNFGVGNTWNCLTEKADELIAGQYNNPSQLYHGLWIGISSWQWSATQQPVGIHLLEPLHG